MFVLSYPNSPFSASTLNCITGQLLAGVPCKIYFIPKTIAAPNLKIYSKIFINYAPIEIFKVLVFSPRPIPLATRYKYSDVNFFTSTT